MPALLLRLLFCFLPGPFAVSAQPAATGAAVAPKAIVYVFLSETCPICQFYTLPLRELYQQYEPQGIAFVGVFPGALSTPASVHAFGQKYRLAFPLQPDSAQRLTSRLDARITPEVVMTDAVTQQVLYRGRIDDSYVALGKRRPQPRTQDLRAALDALVSHLPVAVRETPAVGCLIQRIP